jgi:antagonist of KipI
VGNELNEAVIELHFPSAALFFEQPALIALSGADFSATVNGEEIPGFRPVIVNKYSILQFHHAVSGARAYLAVHGGLDMPHWLNSASTHLKAAAGGYKGRALQKDDEIRLRTTMDFSTILQKREFEILPWKTDDDWGDHITEEILVLPGNEWDRLHNSSKENFFEQLFHVTTQSDRMGYYLKGEPLVTTVVQELVSSAASFGTVQLLPDGQLIVLMADHQTTGGYPRIAHVISAHHSRMAQMKPGDQFRFRFTDQQTAEELFIKQKQHLIQLQNACKFKLEELLHAGH